MTVPFGTPISYSNCVHTDVACLLQAAQSQMNSIRDNGSCAVYESVSLAPPSSSGQRGGGSDIPRLGEPRPIKKIGSGLLIADDLEISLPRLCVVAPKAAA